MRKSMYSVSDRQGREMGFFSSDLQFLKDGAIASKVRELLESSKQVLVLVSPYLDPGDDFIRLISRAASQGARVTIVFRKDKVAEYSSTKWFRTLSDAKVELCVVDRLHSKLYLNESGAVLTSMNLVVSSINNSHETGVFVESDHDLYEKLLTYLEDLESSIEDAHGAKRERAPERGARRERAHRSQRDSGHCIRCNDAIPLDAEHPYCSSDYEAWAKYKNADYVDRHCHGCGRAHPATKRKPLCESCFAKRAA